MIFYPDPLRLSEQHLPDLQLQIVNSINSVRGSSSSIPAIKIIPDPKSVVLKNVLDSHNKIPTLISTNIMDVNSPFTNTIKQISCLL